MATVYCGTYSTRGSEGLYRLDFDLADGTLRPAGVLASPRNPSFLALHPTQPWLYTVCEEEQAGAVTALTLTGARGEAAVLNWQSTLGIGPCHCALDPTGEFLAAANYRSGDLSLHRIGADGRLSRACDFMRHAGSGPVADRQEGPHAHSANFDPTGCFLLVADLGIDRLMVYALDRERGKLSEQVPGGMTLPPGAGPRHLCFHPNGRWVYLINELDNTVVAYDWACGALTALQTLSTLPEDFTGTSYCAEVRVHPSGRFLYGSNRGHDSLAIFAIAEAEGRLTPLGHTPTGGEHPRHFTLSPEGRWLLVGNMFTDTIVVFRVAEAGGLQRVGEELTLPSPTCLLFGRE